MTDEPSLDYALINRGVKIANLKPSVKPAELFTIGGLFDNVLATNHKDWGDYPLSFLYSDVLTLDEWDTVNYTTTLEFRSTWQGFSVFRIHVPSSHPDFTFYYHNVNTHFMDVDINGQTIELQDNQYCRFTHISGRTYKITPVSGGSFSVNVDLTPDGYFVIKGRFSYIIFAFGASSGITIDFPRSEATTIQPIHTTSTSTIANLGTVTQFNSSTAPYYSGLRTSPLSTQSKISGIFLINPLIGAYKKGLTLDPHNSATHPELSIGTLKATTKVHDTGCCTFEFSRALTSTEITTSQVTLTVKSTDQSFIPHATLGLRNGSLAGGDVADLTGAGMPALDPTPIRPTTPADETQPIIIPHVSRNLITFDGVYFNGHVRLTPIANNSFILGNPATWSVGEREYQEAGGFRIKETSTLCSVLEPRGTLIHLNQKGLTVTLTLKTSDFSRFNHIYIYYFNNFGGSTIAINGNKVGVVKIDIEIRNIGGHDYIVYNVYTYEIGNSIAGIYSPKSDILTHENHIVTDYLVGYLSGRPDHPIDMIPSDKVIKITYDIVGDTYETVHAIEAYTRSTPTLEGINVSHEFVHSI